MVSNVSSHGLNRFNMDWFVVDGPYAKVKNECTGVFHDELEKMHKTQKAACAQAREQLVDKLSKEQMEYLSSTYDPENMSYSEYRSFLDDLCKFGYFAEEDKPNVSCGVGSGNLMMIPVSYYAQCGASFSPTSYVPGQTKFPSNSGNVLSWTKHLSTYGTYNPLTGRFEKTEQALLFERLQDALQQIRD